VNPPEPSLRRAWCDIDTLALAHNMHVLREIVGPRVRLTPVVKGNAYGHGLLEASRAFVDAGVDGLCTDSLHEAEAVRAQHPDLFLYVLGYVPPQHAERLVRARASVVLYGFAEAKAFSDAARVAGQTVGVHLKLETGNNRQGLPPDEALTLARYVQRLPGLQIEGVSSHFANVEDTTDHTFARDQLAIFQQFLSVLAAENIRPPLPNIANSAATLLWPEAHFGLVRPGIASYGMWPSSETLLSTMLAGRAPVTLKPALAWRTRIAQVKNLPAGVHVGYGATFQTTHPTRLAILPIGYYDGYDRRLSNLSYVLVCGQRAPLRGRVCMNMVMVDVTDIPGAVVGAEVTLLGPSNTAAPNGSTPRISAEDMAGWMHTINYEVTTRIHESIPRIPFAGPPSP
jgi:alanine racemase